MSAEGAAVSVVGSDLGDEVGDEDTISIVGGCDVLSPSMGIPVGAKVSDGTGAVVSDGIVELSPDANGKISLQW